jgi:hypothetical protein
LPDKGIELAPGHHFFPYKTPDFVSIHRNVMPADSPDSCHFVKVWVTEL